MKSINRFRRSFIIIAMLSVFLVIFIILGSINIINYQQANDRVDKILTEIARSGGSFREIPLDEGFNKEVRFDTRFFVAFLNEEEKLIRLDLKQIAAVSTQEAEDYVAEALKKGKTQAYIQTYKYKIVDGVNGKYIIFVDNQRELNAFYSFLVTSIVMALLGMIAVFVLVLFFSKKAIIPLVENYQKQKSFITNASHELRTPLTIIEANNSILEMNIGENKWIQSTQTQIKRLTSLTKNLLTLAKSDEDVDLEQEDFNLSNILLDSIEAFSDLSKKQAKSFETEIVEDIQYFGDIESFYQIFSILIDNALKYGKEETPIKILLKKVGSSIKFQISNYIDDTSPLNIDHFFDRFYRFDTARNSEQGGSGLGTSIAEALVLAHKGKIEAKIIEEDQLTITILL